MTPTFILKLKSSAVWVERPFCCDLLTFCRFLMADSGALPCCIVLLLLDRTWPLSRRVSSGGRLDPLLCASRCFPCHLGRRPLPSGSSSIVVRFKIELFSKNTTLLKEKGRFQFLFLNFVWKNRCNVSVFYSFQIKFALPASGGEEEQPR